MSYKILCVLSEALFCHAPGEKATCQSKILDLRSQKSLLQHNMCPKFFQKSLHPNWQDSNIQPTAWASNYGEEKDSLNHSATCHFI